MILRETMRIGIERALREMDHEKLVQSALAGTLDYLECLQALQDASPEAFTAFIARERRPPTSPLAGLDPVVSP